MIVINTGFRASKSFWLKILLQLLIVFAGCIYIYIYIFLIYGLETDLKGLATETHALAVK